MDPSWQPLCVLSPRLVVYRDEEIVSPRLKRLASLIPTRPWERRPPGETIPQGIRSVEVSK
jgi:hypothetical protein